jgi:hypothetical protein
MGAGNWPRFRKLKTLRNYGNKKHSIKLLFLGKVVSILQISGV